MLNKSKCEVRHCKYFRGLRTLEDGKEVLYCKAFKFGIPEDIAYGENDHSVVIEKQKNDLTYGRGPDPTLVKPFPRKGMHNPNLWGCDNLCSTLRDIYVKTRDREIRNWCRIGVRMSKNMCLALITYQQMLVELGVDVSKHGRVDWQLHGEEMYREKNKK